MSAALELAVHQHVEPHALLPADGVRDQPRHLGVVGGEVDLPLVALDAEMAHLAGLWQ